MADERADGPHCRSKHPAGTPPLSAMNLPLVPGRDAIVEPLICSNVVP